MRRAKLRGDVIVPAHPHGKDAESVAGGDFRQQRKMRGRRLVRGGNAHQPLDFKAEFVPALTDESVRLLGKRPRLLRLGARVHLDEKARSVSLASRLFRKRPCDLRAIDRLDDVEKRDRFAGLVRLQGGR